MFGAEGWCDGASVTEWGAGAHMSPPYGFSFLQLSLALADLTREEGGEEGDRIHKDGGSEG